MIKYVVSVFIIMIIIYFILTKITEKREYFCETTTDTSYNEYQDILSDSQMAVISQMIKNQSTQILSSAGGIVPGPRGKQGRPGPPGGKYVASGLILNGDDMLDNKMNLNDKLNTTIGTNNIWYLLDNGKIINKKFTSNNNNNNSIVPEGNACLNINNNKLELSSCDNATKWIWNSNGNIKSNNQCLTNNNSSAIISKCNNSSDSKQKWIIN